MQAVDQALLLSMVDLGASVPGLAILARGLTEVGGYRVLIPLTIFGSIWLLGQRELRRAAVLLLITVGGRLVVEMSKSIIDRPRPTLSAHQVDVSSLSFPSGHAANSMIVFLALALIVGPMLTRRAWPVAAAVIGSVLVGLTRPMLAVHWPSDVLAGWALGLAWTLSGVWLFDRWMKGQPIRATGRPPDRS